MLVKKNNWNPVGVMLSFLWIDYLYVKNNPIIHCKIKETLLIRDLLTFCIVIIIMVIFFLSAADSSVCY